jgi:hypothetical protein
LIVLAFGDPRERGLDRGERARIGPGDGEVEERLRLAQVQVRGAATGDRHRGRGQARLLVGQQLGGRHQQDVGVGLVGQPPLERERLVEGLAQQRRLPGPIAAAEQG